MNRYDAIQKLSAITSKINDPEIAHSLEDDVYFEFISYIASGKITSIEEVIEVANILKSSKELDFPRWCA